MFELMIAAIASFAAERALTPLAEKVRDKVVDEAAGRLVGTFLESQNQQMQLLRSIDGKVDALIQGDFRSGLEFLGAAADGRRAPAARAKDVEDARSRFMDALGKEGDNPARRATICLYLGAANLAMDDWYAAEHSFERAYLGALEASHSMVRSTWRGERSAAAPLLPLLDEIREARIALGALPTSVPAFTTGADIYPLAALQVDDRGNAVDRGRGIEVSRQLPAHWRYLMLLPTATLPTVAEGKHEVTGRLGRDALFALQGALGPESVKGPDELLGALLNEALGSRTPRLRNDLATYSRVASELVEARRANWPFRPEAVAPPIA